MKTFCLLALLLLPSLAEAQDDAPIVSAPVDKRELSLLLIKGKQALVRDERRVSLPTGRSILQFAEVPFASEDVDQSSIQLSIESSVKVFKQHSGSFYGFSYGLAAFVGKQVTLLRPQTGGSEKVVTGKLLRASSPVLLETNEGVLLDPPGVWVLPREGAEDQPAPGILSTQPFGAMQWWVEPARAGTFPVVANYAMEKLDWNARYTATLSPARDSLKLRGWLDFKNDAQTVFSNARLTLRDSNGFDFNWPGIVTLQRNENQLAYVAADVPVTESLIYALESGRSFAQAINNAHPQRSMTLENSAANGLGVYLPTGSLSLWQGEAEKTLRLDKTATWGAFSPGDIISVPLGANEAISLDRFIVSSKLLNPVTREIVVAWKVTAQNGAPPVTIIDNAPARFKLTGATLKPVAVANNQLRFEVNVPNNTPVEFRYTVEVPA